MAAKIFNSCAQELSVESVPVVGTVPHWLSGVLVRTCPAKFEVFFPLTYHLQAISFLFPLHSLLLYYHPPRSPSSYAILLAGRGKLLQTLV
jgi:Retinal pigment epithelial membrane protein